MSQSHSADQVSQAPTRPPSAGASDAAEFDVADLYRDASAVTASEASTSAHDEKLRQAYFWVVNHGIISPFYDIEYNDAPAQSYSFGDQKVRVTLPSEQSYSSYVLLPLLNLALRRRCLLVGGPGRGKTVIAKLMGILSGYSLTEIRQGIQHGQPQMTVADLLGNPIPSTLMSAETMDEVRIAWRKWLSMRIKIIDEYNRIPTRTQSALLTVMADNYAEIYDQVYECPEAAWYLTANDDAGGGTYQVIEALSDRIDVVVKALHFNTRFLDDLVLRIEEGVRPETMVPEEIIFTEAEFEEMSRQIRKVKLPRKLRRRFEFFASHFEFFEPGARQFEYMTKDTVKLTDIELQSLAGGDSGKDGVADLGSQTRNGLSVRALMTCIAFMKGMAYFRGEDTVSYEDMRQILPFVLHDKLVQEPDSPYFEQTNHGALRTDKVSWIRTLLDLSSQEFERLNLDADDPVGAFEIEFEKGLEDVSAREVRKRMVAIERVLKKWSDGGKLYGHMFDDILKLKYLHQRYTNYLRWLEWKT
ncbi:AAA family ATPase [Bradymonas sediminis]|uniref:ATPase n=1 Tax=Bradymonas sediminis TaxID=1548548 RepID=A0A2Z4FIU5_9DELT|nr:AAA family ATPase [Bradymonas sediminis]AWV88862.1 ATPase [Bradymonas sediminis]TDP71864.1 ATPase family protein associated with various cellular activities (AAA) [Bradymonas sediminis]